MTTVRLTRHALPLKIIHSNRFGVSSVCQLVSFLSNVLRTERSIPTNKREKEYDRAFGDLQAALRRSAGQPAGADILVPAGGVPERVLSRPPDPGYQEEASRECMAFEASHDLPYGGGNKSIGGLWIIASVQNKSQGKPRLLSSQ